MKVFALCTAFVVLAWLPAAAQPAPAAQQPAAATPQAAPATAAGASAPEAGGPQTPPAAPPENYTYQADGRRDPFVNLLGTGTEPAAIQRGDGPAGLTVAEISVRGVMRSRGTLVAMIQGPDNRTYVIHQGDRLADGIVKSVVPEGLVIVQDVNDPLSIVKQREIRKLLRSLEDAKERL